MLNLTDNKVVTSVEVIFYETLSLEVWKAKYGPASRRTHAHPPTDTSTATVPLLAKVNEPADEDVVEVLPPPPVLPTPSPVADRLASTPVSATGDEGSLEALPAAPASGIAGARQGAKLVDQNGKLSTTREHQTGEPVKQEATARVQSTGEQQPGWLTGELSKSAACEQPVEGSKQLVDNEDVDEEGEQSAGEESTDSDVVEAPITMPELRRTGQARRPPQRLSFHTCPPPAAFTTGALASWKGEALKAAMEEEIRSLIGMGTWELVERPRGVITMKNRWVLTTKYRIDDTVEHEKARLVLDIKNAFLQSKLDRVPYMYQPDYFDNGTSRVCKVLKSLYGPKQSPLLWYKALHGVQLGASWKKSLVDEVPYFKAGDDEVTCWVLVYVHDLLAASSSAAMLKELKELLEAAFELREISPGYAVKLHRRFINEEQGSRVPKTPVLVDAYGELTFDDKEAQKREEEYRRKVGSLQFAATMTWPDIVFACSKLGSGLKLRSD
ncbi:unnamed protein product [Closterium sp. NIES-64]|nr:unnamed protein product [Closterium sp. NIES-64]